MKSDIKYSSAHVRLTRTRGRAAEYECSCGDQAAHWAYTHDNRCPNEMVSDFGQKYSGDVTRYVAMCAICHSRYDRPTITHCPQGHEYAGDNLIIDGKSRKCRTCVYKRNNDRRKEFGMTREQKDRKLELQRIRRAQVQLEPASAA